MSQADADAIGRMLLLFMILLPLGWLAFRSSIGFAVLAIVQIGLVLLTVVWAYRFSRRHNCGRILASLAAAASYFACCLLTNVIGELIMKKAFHL